MTGNGRSRFSCQLISGVKKGLELSNQSGQILRMWAEIFGKPKNYLEN